jgi:hypothetical protein
LCSKIACCNTVMKKCRPACCDSSCKNEPSKNCCCWCRSSSTNASGDADIELIDKITIKPYFTSSDKENPDKQEMRQLLNQNTTSFSNQPIPASAPLEEGIYRDPEHIRIHAELSKTRSESRQTMNNQIVVPPKQNF